MLRPELLKEYKHPLSSDAFSPMGFHDAKEHDQEVIDATNFLKETVIPSLGMHLDQNYGQKNIEYILSRLSYETHRRGVNTRYLGLVRKHTKSQNIRSALIIVFLFHIIFLV